MRRFSHQVTTSASKAAIWAIWKDVERWNAWDDQLKSSRLDGAFTLGTRGRLTPLNGPESPFAITEYTQDESFTFTVRLPLARLEVAHYFLPGAQTTFVHAVEFNGPLGVVFGRILGRGYAAALPGVMNRIRAIAEGK